MTLAENGGRDSVFSGGSNFVGQEMDQGSSTDTPTHTPTLAAVFRLQQIYNHTLIFSTRSGGSFDIPVSTEQATFPDLE